MLNIFIQTLFPIFAGIIFSILSKGKISARPISLILFWFLVPLLVLLSVVLTDITFLLKIAGISFIFLLFSGYILSVFGFYSYLFNKSQIFLLGSYLNIGWFGLPISLLLFGQSAFDFILGSYLAGSFIGSSIAIYVVVGEKHNSILAHEFLKAPVIYAFILGILLNFFNFSTLINADISEILEFTRPMLSKIVLISSMFLVGASSLSSLIKVKTKTITPHILFFLNRAIISILIAIVFISILDVDSIEFLLFLCILPSAANISVLYHRYNISNEVLSLQILISTILSMFCIYGISFIIPLFGKG